jgi:hypothetical protein
MRSLEHEIKGKGREEEHKLKVFYLKDMVQGAICFMSSTEGQKVTYKQEIVTLIYASKNAETKNM